MRMNQRPSMCHDADWQSRVLPDDRVSASYRRVIARCSRAHVIPLGTLHMFAQSLDPGHPVKLVVMLSQMKTAGRRFTALCSAAA